MARDADGGGGMRVSYRGVACSVDDCDRGAEARGWCQKHYKRWQEWGDPTYTQDQALTDAGFLLAAAVMEKVGCTYRQLDYWRRMGYVNATLDANGSGSRVGFRPKEVRAIYVLTVFSEAGMVPGTPIAEAAVAHVRRHGVRGSVSCGVLSVSLDGLTDPVPDP